MNTPVALIVATSTNNVIGKDNKLPWHLPRDLQYFKTVTTGSPIIMGRKTYESIGKALPQRVNIIVTNNTSYQADDALVVHSLQNALEQARQEQPQCETIFIIGGESIFAQALSENLVDTLYINKVLADFEGDTFLPKIHWNHWQLDSSEAHKADEKNAYDLVFEVYSLKEIS